MAALGNTFEGGSSGTTVTTGNSGGTSGDAFGSVVVDTGNALVYDSAQAAHGTLSVKVSTGATSGSAYVAWTSGIPGTSATLWARAYVRLSANPAAAVNVLRMLSASNGIMGTIRVNAAGTIGMLYGSGTLADTSDAAIPLGSWWRVEVMVTAGTTTGVMTARLYWTPDATTPDDTLTISGVNTGAANPTRLRAGVVSNLANVAAIHLDDLGLSDVDWLGPVGGPTTITGTMPAVLPAAAASAAATLRATGTAPAQLPALTVQAAAALRQAAALAPALRPAETGLDGAVRVAGQLPATLPALDSAAAADLTVPGALGAVLAPVDVDLSAAQTGANTLDADLPAAELDAAARVVVRGALALTLPPASVAATGETPITIGTLAATLPPIAATATARTVIRAALAAALPAVQADATEGAPAAVDADITLGAPAADAPPGPPHLGGWTVGPPRLGDWSVSDPTL